jgi:hypothetical protein
VGADLGWTSLLVSDAHGGGSISGQGLVDLSSWPTEFGRHAAPGRGREQRGGRHVERDGDPKNEPVLQELLSGESIATWCLGEPPSPMTAGQRLAFDIRGRR